MHMYVVHTENIISKRPNKQKDIETDADKIRLGYSKFVTILLMIMLIGIHMLKIETLRILKWQNGPI